MPLLLFVTTRDADPAENSCWICICKAMLFSEFLAVLGTELICAFAAFQRDVGYFPETFGIDQHAQLPNQPGKNRHDHQRYGIKSSHKNQRGEHHQVIPVENAAGGAAFVLHDQPEGTPDQNADQVTDIEADGDHKEPQFADHVRIIQYADQGDQGDPEQHDLVCGFCGGYDVVFQGLGIDLFADGTETVGKKFLRTQGHFVFYGNDLLNHIRDPDDPQKMQGGESREKVSAFQNIKYLRRDKAHQQAQDENCGPTDQADKVSLSCF